MKLLLVYLLRMGFRDLVIGVGLMRLEFREGPIKHYYGFRQKDCWDRFKISYTSHLIFTHDS